MAILLAVIGPGIITANVDNDAGGITTYSIAGADWGTGILWTFLPIAVLLVVVQEMVNRMGVVTGKGLADLIRENFGARATFYLMVALVVTNLGNVMAEFAGVSAAARLFGWNPALTVSGAVLGLWVLVVKGTQRSVEKVFLVACLFYLAYVLAGFLVKPDWTSVVRDTVVPTLPPAGHRTAWILMVVGLVGTTVAPWMQFYQQAAVAEKGVRPEQLRYSTADTVLGGFTVMIVAAFIVVACAAAIFAREGGVPPAAGHRIESAADAAVALLPVAGKHAESLFAFGLLSASLFAASILPLSTAFSVCEGLGFETGVNKRVPEAPTFYTLYGLLLLLGACVVFVPESWLVRIMFYSQVVNGLVLPLVLFFIVRLVRDRRVMGKYANGRAGNAVAWTVSGAVALLTLVSLAALAWSV